MRMGHAVGSEHEFEPEPRIDPLRGSSINLDPPSMLSDVSHCVAYLAATNERICDEAKQE